MDLPKDYRAFDYDTISDIVLHIRYTARQGVDTTPVKAALSEIINQDELTLLFSLRHDFSTEWSVFINGTGDFTTNIRKDYFPYLANGKTINILGHDLYDGKGTSIHHVDGDGADWGGDLNDSSKRAVTVTVGTAQGL